MRFSEQILTQSAWFLDYDGSLCPHLEIWEERLYDATEIFQCLDTLSQKSAALFWNTGRRPESLFSVYEDFSKFPGYFIQGSVFYDSKNKKSDLLGPKLPEELVRTYKELVERHPQFRLEIKETSLRIAPHKSLHVESLHSLVETHSLGTFASDWGWSKGRRGVELLARGIHKGTPLEMHLKANPSHIPIAVGDDVFDMPAVSAALRFGGFAFLVGDHCGWITEIPHWAEQIKYFESPQMLLDWINRL